MNKLSDLEIVFNSNAELLKDCGKFEIAEKIYQTFREIIEKINENRLQIQDLLEKGLIKPESFQMLDVQIRIQEENMIQNFQLQLYGLLPEVGMLSIQEKLIGIGEVLKDILNNTTDIMWIKDKDGKYLWSNNAANQEFKPEIGKNDDELWEGEDIRNYIKMTDIEIMKKGGSVTYEDISRGKHFLITKGATYSSDGEVTGTFGIAKDITSFREKELEYHRLFDNSLVGVYCTDLDGKFEVVNKKFAEIFGYDSPNVLIESINAGDLYQDPNKRVELINQLEESGSVSNVEMALLRKDGKILSLILSVTKVNDKFYGVIRDITALKERAHYAHLAGMARIAINSNHNIGNDLNTLNTLIYNIGQQIEKLKKHISGFDRGAHALEDTLPDLKQLIISHASWQDFSDFFEEKKWEKFPTFFLKIISLIEDQEIKVILNELNEIAKISKHIQMIIDKQSEYTKYEELGNEKVNLKKLIEESILSIFEKNMFYIKNSMLFKEFSTDNLVINLDSLKCGNICVQKVAFMEVLISIFENSVEAFNDLELQKPLIPEETPEKLIINISAEENGDEINLNIIDNGIGINPENSVKIFNHGFSTKEKLGFGLHMCANSLAEMNASIKCHSEGIGKGTHITIVFPKCNI